jgi:hypothetical protein
LAPRRPKRKAKSVATYPRLIQLHNREALDRETRLR